MPLKEGFIDGYILDRNDAFILLVLEDPVYQEQRDSDEAGSPGSPECQTSAYSTVFG